MGYDAALKSFANLASELVTDDDLKAKLDFEAEKLKFELDKVLLQTTTTPKTDAFVKILIAVRDVVIPLLRPVGSLLMALFGAYCVTNGIELSETIQVALFGSPLAYGVSRHSAKKDEQLTERLKLKRSNLDGEDFD